MREATQVVRYSGEDALVVLKSDIESTLTNLKSIEKIKDFRFVNETLLDKVNQIRCAVTLETERSQVITITFFFLERVCETAFVRKWDALFENILINRSIATCKDIQSLVHSILLAKYKGFSSEDLVFNILKKHIDDNPQGTLKSIRHGESYEDRRGKDFILKAQISGKDFEFAIDVKSHHSFMVAKKRQKKKRNKAGSTKKLVMVDKKEITKDPNKFIVRIISLAQSIYGNVFLEKK